MEKIARIGEEGLDLVVCPEFSVMPLILLLGAITNQWRRNYRDRGVHRTPQVQDLYPLYPHQVKDAAYVKILSKRL